MCNKPKTYLVSILVALATGGLSALLSRGGMEQYASLNLPPLSPPGIVFPIVWTILFILMGISAALIYCSEDLDRQAALRIYAAQLVVNFFWSIFFFGLQWRLFSFFWLLLLAALVIWMIVRFSRILPLAGWLQLPYLLWLVFAGYLNLGVWFLNRG